MKILIVCTTSVGDVIFSTPLARSLKVQVDHLELHYALPSTWHLVLEANPYIDKVVDAESLSLNNISYDVMIDLDQSWYRKVRCLWSKCKYTSYQPHRWEQWLMSALKINKLKNVHVADRMLSILDVLNLRHDESGLDYFVPEKGHVPLEWLPEGFQKEFVVFSITSPYETRKLPVERIIEVCDRINKPVILIGTEQDATTGVEVERFFTRNRSGADWEEGLRALGKKAIVYNGCGKFNANQLASLIKQSYCLFTFDNDHVPVASAFKKQVFLFLGNTITLFGRYPYKTRFVIMENNKIACRPCTSTGHSRCPAGHFKCMKEQVFDFYVN